MTSRFPVSQETLFLFRFVMKHCTKVRNVVELGCGVGFLCLALKKLKPSITVLGLDIQDQLIRLAELNAKQNSLGSDVTFTHGDLRVQSELPKHYSQDLVIANPPFRKLNTGKISSSRVVSISSHEITATLLDYIYSASLILKSGGFLGLVMLPDRLPELFELMTKRQINPTILQFIHHDNQSPANAVLVLGKKQGNMPMSVIPPEIVGE